MYSATHSAMFAACFFHTFECIPNGARHCPRDSWICGLDWPSQQHLCKSRIRSFALRWRKGRNFSRADLVPDLRKSGTKSAREKFLPLRQRKAKLRILLLHRCCCEGQSRPQIQESRGQCRAPLGMHSKVWKKQAANIAECVAEYIYLLQKHVAHASDWKFSSAG